MPIDEERGWIGADVVGVDTFVAAADAPGDATGMSTRGYGTAAENFVATPSSLGALASFRVAVPSPDTDGVRRGGGGAAADFFTTSPLTTLMPRDELATDLVEHPGRALRHETGHGAMATGERGRGGGFSGSARECVVIAGRR
jgi:hypothetical protein